MLRASTAIIFVLVAPPLLAETNNGIPDFDPVQICKKQAAAINQGDWLIKACLDQEQSSYDSVKEQWADLDIKTKSICTQQARTLGMGYFLLNACVEQEVAAKKDVENFKFKK